MSAQPSGTPIFPHWVLAMEAGYSYRISGDTPDLELPPAAPIETFVSRGTVPVIRRTRSLTRPRNLAITLTLSTRLDAFELRIMLAPIWPYW